MTCKQIAVRTPARHVMPFIYRSYCRWCPSSLLPFLSSALDSCFIEQSIRTGLVDRLFPLSVPYPGYLSSSHLSSILCISSLVSWHQAFIWLKTLMAMPPVGNYNKFQACERSFGELPVFLLVNRPPLATTLPVVISEKIFSRVVNL